MSIAYQPPGTSIAEAVTTAFQTSLVNPHNVCIIGPTQGYLTRTERVLLSDNTPHVLGVQNPDVSTISIVDASDLSSAPFQASTGSASLDYDIDTTNLSLTGRVSVKRSMQTTIANGETVVAYYETNGSPTQGNSYTDLVTLNTTVAAVPTHMASGFQPSTLLVTRAGLVPAGDYTLVTGASPTIVWKNTATTIAQFQTLYLDYTVGSAVFADVPVQLNALSVVNLPSNATNIVVKNAPQANISITATAYRVGTTTDLDYIVSGSGATTAIARSTGTTTMGASADKLVVRISYRATPTNYWAPTRCFSQSAVETKYGSAFDSGGNVVNPVSLATAVAFSNGAQSIIVQPLFQEGTPRTNPTGAVVDWSNTLANLRDVQDIDVIVPLVSCGGLSTNDAQNLLILQAVQQHLNYMMTNEQQFVGAMCGEDSTSRTMASEAILQSHAQTLRANFPAQGMSLVSPGAFTYVNPITGKANAIGGQFVAAAVAGFYGKYAPQIPFTKKALNIITGVTDRRTEPQKNADAAAGLLVIENKRGQIKVRHGITTADDTIAHRELSVVRLQNWMMSNVQRNADQQLSGNLLIDANATFHVQLVVEGVLQDLVDNSTIVGYSAVQVARDPDNPTGVIVQFTYTPPYPLNNITISFSLDSTNGVDLTTLSTATNAL